MNKKQEIEINEGENKKLNFSDGSSILLTGASAQKNNLSTQSIAAQSTLTNKNTVVFSWVVNKVTVYMDVEYTLTRSPNGMVAYITRVQPGSETYGYGVVGSYNGDKSIDSNNAITAEASASFQVGIDAVGMSSIKTWYLITKISDGRIIYANKTPAI
ncbi:hypothetical protein JQN58_39160 [Aneurinibacillus sp. BA2021]|nr:hypothetical protein [Aneurinibacillus sp. BA2021]